MIIRVLSILLGLFFIGSNGFMLVMKNDSFVSSLTGIFLGIMFIIYGVGGNRMLSKILPALSKTWRGKQTPKN